MKPKEAIAMLLKELCGDQGCPQCGNADINNFYLSTVEAETGDKRPKEPIRKSVLHLNCGECKLDLTHDKGKVPTKTSEEIEKFLKN